MQDEKKTKKELVQELTELRKLVKKLEAKEAPKKKAKGSLLNLDNGLKKLFDSLSDFFFMLDEKGHILYCNSAVKERLGYSDEELLGENALMVHPPELRDEAASILSQLLKGKGDICPIPLLAKNGTLIPVETKVTRGRWGKRNVLFYIGRDISKRKKIEEELRETNLKLQTLIDAIPDVVFFKDAEGRHLIVNKAHEDIHGIRNEDIVGKTVEELLPPNTAELCRKSDDGILKGKKSVRTEESIIDKDGRKLFLDVIKIPLYDEKGNPRGLVGIGRDITEHKIAGKKLRESEERFRNLFEMLPIGISITDTAGNIIGVNKESEKILGLSHEEHLKRTLQSPEWDIYKHDASPMSAEELPGFIALSQKQAVENIDMGMRKSNGELVWLNVTAIPIPLEGNGVLIAYMDITKLKMAEDELRDEKTFTEIALNTLEDVFFVIDLNEKFLRWNKAMNKMTGYSDNEISLMRPADFFIMEDIHRVEEAITIALKEGSAGLEVTLFTKDGRHVPVEISGSLLKNQRGETLGICGISRDIAERKRAEELLKEREERYRELFNGVTDAIYVHHVSPEKPGKFVAVNESACRMLGYSTDEFLQMEVKNIDVPEQEEEIPAIHEKLYKDGFALFETHHLAKDGKKIPVEINIRMIKFEGKPAVLSVVRDITERNLGEEKLRESEERYRQIVELSPDTIFIQTEGKIAFINAAGLKLFGAANPEELVGKKVLDLMHPDYRELVKERIRMLNIEGKEVPLQEQKYLRLDGTSVDVEVAAKPVTYFGKPGAQVMVRDITARKQAEGAMERLRSRNELILKSAGEGILGLDLEGKQTFLNQSAARMLGYEVEELLGQRSHAVWHYSKADGSPYPEDECPIYAAYKDGNIHRINKDVFWRKDGKSFPVDYTSTPIMENGNIVGAVVTFSDISERKKAEDALRVSEEKFRSLVSSSSEHIFIIGKDGRYLFSNGRIGQFGNIQGGSIIGLGISDVYPQDTAWFYKEQVDHVFSTGEKLDFEHTLSEPDGLHYHLDTLFPIEREGDIWGVGGICRDVTEGKKAAEEKEALSVISQLFLTRDNPKDIYNELPWILSERFKFPIVTMELYDQGESTMKLVGSIGAEYSEESELFSLPFEQSIAGKTVLTGKPFYDLEADKLSEDQLGILGGMGIRTIICIPIPGKNIVFGTITLADTRRRRGLEAFIKTLQVIANHLAQELERLKTWDALRLAKKEWEHTFDAVPDLVCILDKEFRIVRLNLAMSKKLGMQPADCIGKICYEVVHGAGTPPAFCPHAQLLHDGEEHTVEIYEERLGGYFIITTSPIYDENGQLIGSVHMARDITERKLIENQIKSSLSEKEILLREIHHRVKNNIQIISSLMKLSSDTIKDQSILDIFTESQNRIKSMALIHEKLYQSSDLARINFAEYIESLSHELYRAYGIDPDRITMRLSMESIPLGIDKAIPSGLIVNELITNALKHAFPEETEGEIVISLADKGKGVIELIISDNGIGVPPSIDLSTTKTLGLYIVHILAEDQLEGSVTLDRTKGTTFRITFSRKDEKTK